MISFLTADLECRSGGFCPNSTDYCNFGCCGDENTYFCCFPIGVFIGCGFGALGTIFLLITIMKCRTGNASQRQQRAAQEGSDQDYGVDNHGMSVDSLSSSTRQIDMTGEPKYFNYTSPPSYESVMSSTVDYMISSGYSNNGTPRTSAGDSNSGTPRTGTGDSHDGTPRTAAGDTNSGTRSTGDSLQPLAIDATTNEATYSPLAASGIQRDSSQAEETTDSTEDKID